MQYKGNKVYKEYFVKIGIITSFRFKTPGEKHTVITSETIFKK